MPHRPAEAILLDPDTAHEELEEAKDLAEAINTRDEGNPACEEEDGSPPPNWGGGRRS